MKKVNVFWFRRDLRLNDNVGFHKALKGKYPLLPIFIFDQNILGELPKNDARVTFIFGALQKMRSGLQKNWGGLALYHGSPKKVFQTIFNRFDVQNIITNRDYEPYAKARDEKILKLAQNSGVGFYTFKDHVIFEKDEITKPNGGPYVVYTPYMKRWRATFNAEKHLKTYPAHQHLGNLYKNTVLPNLSLAQIGFERSHIRVPGHDVTQTLLQQYEGTRNFPAKDGTSQVGPHLRFGTVSIREIVKKAIAQKNPVFLQELIWREFFIQVLYHFPKTVTNAFKPKYDRIPWRTDKTDIKAWQQGKTGYPLVDAGIRQLNKTGYMHNRVRMVVASFFCKHLLLNWRLGEAYFAQKLLDYEQASNVGNWQWAAGSGVDAAPYFRVFNPTAQAEKFDKGHKYIKTWVKEFGTAAYPEPIVDHKKARERAISTYKKALYQ